MQEHVTLLGPQESPGQAGGLSSSLPQDLLEQIRGRVRLLALLMMIGFALDPLIFFGGWAVAGLTGRQLPADFFRDALFYWGDVLVVVASASLWWMTRARRVAVSQLHTFGLLYEVAICFVLSLRTFWEYYRDTGMLPNLTWVPAVIILFPLILPAPPRVMLTASIAAGAMSPLALMFLDLAHQVPVDAATYFNTSVGSVIAISFAYMGSRVVYRLGREVAAARELGSYRLEEKLGQGGMGEVWRARHRMLARPAAIKLIRAGAADGAGIPISADARQRFEREAQVIARLRSPHTVDLFDFGVAQNGAFYYVMELLEGMDADRLVRQFGPLPAERAIFILRQICHSLSEAESYGLVHRDIKPANIFLCRYGEDYDFVKVLDFGLVKALGDETDAAPALTGEHTVHGTPAFIAPEQALGKRDLDGRVDIYATGCVAYWLLTGKLVFNADNAMGLLMQHVHASPVPPSSRTELPVPAELDRLVLQCLAKDPNERPQTARQLARQLSAIDAHGQWTEVLAQAWWTKHEPAPV